MFLFSALIPGFNQSRKSIKSKFLLNLKSWQVSLVVDITQAKKDVVVIAGISTNKSLPYQSIPIIIRGIVLVVSSIIAFIEDQVNCLLDPVSYISFAKSIAKRNYSLRLNITAVAFTATTIKNDP